jgi:hypothetical protein
LIPDKPQEIPRSSPQGPAAYDFGSLTRAISLQHVAERLPREAYRRGLLVISFLYPNSFFEDFLKRIAEAHSSSEGGANKIPNIESDVMTFYPGSLKPEAMLRKIVRRLDRLRLYGIPVRGILVDGIHNVYLQFPDIAESPHVWPVLYEIFRLLHVTVVTTHTHFEVGGIDPSEAVAIDVRSVNHRIAPLLHVLVGTVDNYIELSAVRTPGSAEAVSAGAKIPH